MRRGLVIAGILLAGVVWGQATHRSLKMTDAQVQQFYEADSDAYFEGGLPHADVRFVHNLRDDNGDALMGLTQGPPFQISLTDRYQDNGSISIMTLHHEECHAALSAKNVEELDVHGPAFQTCMVRLAEAGAFKGIW